MLFQKITIKKWIIIILIIEPLAEECFISLLNIYMIITKQIRIWTLESFQLFQLLHAYNSHIII